MTTERNRVETGAQDQLRQGAADAANQISELLDQLAQSRGGTAAEQAAWIAGITALLSSGKLFEIVGRPAVIRHEIERNREAGVSASVAHTEIAETLGITRQALEQRFHLQGLEGRAASEKLRDQYRANS